VNDTEPSVGEGITLIVEVKNEGVTGKMGVGGAIEDVNEETAKLMERVSQKEKELTALRGELQARLKQSDWFKGRKTELDTLKKRLKRVFLRGLVM
jgi:hypothetical protein